jgi:uncharacterized membrane protein
LRAALSVFFLAAGVLHLTATDPFVSIVPDWVRYPRIVVEITGICEIAGALAVLTRRWRRLAGLMLALYAICVFPANIKHALDGISVPGLPSSWWYHAPRLMAQPIIVWWALYASGVIDWPFARRAHAD